LSFFELLIFSSGEDHLYPSPSHTDHTEYRSNTDSIGDDITDEIDRCSDDNSLRWIDISSYCCEESRREAERENAEKK
jgi:hypothetical protein